VIERGLDLRGPLDLSATLGPLTHGRGDRTIRLARGEAWLAFRTPVGPATLRLRHSSPMRLEASAWGPGAEHALGGAPLLVGEEDRPEAFTTVHPILRRLQRENPGLRLPQTRRVFHALLPSVLEQKVTGTDAFRAYAALLRHHGEPAPGPGGLQLPPAPATLAGLPYTPSTRSASSGGGPRSSAAQRRGPRGWTRRAPRPKRRPGCGRFPASVRGPPRRWSAAPSATPTP